MTVRKFESTYLDEAEPVKAFRLLEIAFDILGQRAITLHGIRFTRQPGHISFEVDGRIHTYQIKDGVLRRHHHTIGVVERPKRNFPSDREINDLLALLYHSFKQAPEQREPGLENIDSSHVTVLLAHIERAFASYVPGLPAKLFFEQSPISTEEDDITPIRDPRLPKSQTESRTGILRAELGVWRRRTQWLSTAILIAMASVPPLVVQLAKQAQEPEVNTKTRANDLVKPLREMTLPPDISDAGAVLLAASPLTGPRYEDPLLDRYGVKDAFYGGLFLIQGVKTACEGGERVYAFAIPSLENGELSKAERANKLTIEASWPDVSALLLRENLSDETLKTFIADWYAKTYKNQAGAPILLEKEEIKIERSADQKVMRVSYAGKHKNDWMQHEVLLEHARTDGRARASNTSSRPSPKPLTKNGELVLLTGVDQDLLIPEPLLCEDASAKVVASELSTVHLSLKEIATATSIYFEQKDKVETKRITTPDGAESTISLWARFVTHQDPVVKRIVEVLTKDAKTQAEAAEKLRLFIQESTYEMESRGVEVNRPAVATLLQESGDCNNRVVYGASFLKARGLRTAILHAMRSASATNAAAARGDAFAFSRHVLIGILEKDLGDLVLPADKTTFTDENGETWVVLETGRGFQFGQMAPSLKDFQIVMAEEVK